MQINNKHLKSINFIYCIFIIHVFNYSSYFDKTLAKHVFLLVQGSGCMRNFLLDDFGTTKNDEFPRI